MSTNYENELIALRTGKNPPERSGECWTKDELLQLHVQHFCSITIIPQQETSGRQNRFEENYLGHFA